MTAGHFRKASSHQGTLNHVTDPQFSLISHFFPLRETFQGTPSSLSLSKLPHFSLTSRAPGFCWVHIAQLFMHCWIPGAELQRARHRTLWDPAHGFGVSLTARSPEVPFLRGIPCWLRVWEYMELIPCCLHGASGRCCSDCKEWKCPRFKLLQPINSGWHRARQPSLCAVSQVGFKT